MEKISSIKTRHVAIVLIVVLLLAQFVKINTKAPSHLPEDDILIAENASVEVKEIMHASCYDCHSYETIYPWYSSIAPISWWTKNHVNEARENINFSDWTHFSTKRQDKKLHECIEVIQEGEMPLKSYTYLHKEAILTEPQRQILVNWFRSLLNK